MDNKNNDESKVVTQENGNTTQSTPQTDSKPQVVEASDTKEVAQTPIDNKQQANETLPSAVKEDTNTTLKEKKGHPIFLVLLMILLFAFVYFLPDITEYVTNYMNERTGANELKSGRMTCTYENVTDNINYNYEITFNYVRNRLRNSTMVTTNRLADTATDTSILTERENACEALQAVLQENNIGMTASCSVSAAVQITTQTINYEELDMDFITSNIAEFEGFYPEYELNESVTVIEQELENNGYTCQRNEYNDASE